jgi:hypothetical protein
MLMGQLIITPANLEGPAPIACRERLGGLKRANRVSVYYAHGQWPGAWQLHLLVLGGL